MTGALKLITITLPVPKEKIREEMDKLLKMSQERQEELRVISVLIQTIRNFCKHDYRNKACVMCGYDYGD